MRGPQRRICQIRSVLARAIIATLPGTMLAACGGGGSSGYMTMATGSSRTSAAATLTVLYSFPSGKGPTASAGGVVQARDGNLYGSGGQSDLFRLSLGGAETDESFNFGSALAEPGLPGALTGPLVLGQDGMLYDTVGCFGTAGNGDFVGAVFSSDLLGNAGFLYTNDFAAGDSCDLPPPVDLVSAPNGTLYFSNDYFGGGEVDGLTPSPQFVQFAFRGQGVGSGAYTIARDGNLYGVGQSGGTYGHGIFYTLTVINGVSQAQILYSFGATGDDASKPTQAPAQGLDGNFYGTSAGGSITPGCPVGCGAVYRITPAGEETVLYSFGTNPADQASATCSPGPLTLGSDGNFYGTYCSVIFQIKPQGQETVLHTMTAADGQQIANGLLQADDGNFYGVTTRGGENNAGTVFKLVVPASH